MPEYIDYGGGAGGYPAGTSLEDIMMRKFGEFKAPQIEPGLATQPTTPVVVAPELTGMQKFGKVTEAIGPILSQFGTTMMRGRNAVTGAPTETVGSQMGGIISSALISQKMNEATKKMIAAQIASGGKGGGAGFNEGQPGGFTAGEVVGLSPEQISGLYGAGLGLRAQELKRPFDELGVISDAYLKVMSGEAKPAEMEAHLATAQKARLEFEAMIPKTLAELAAKDKALDKADAEIAEIKARTLTEKEKPAEVRAETKRKGAETTKAEKQVEEITAKLDPKQVRLLEVAKTAGGQVKISDAGDRLVITDPATGFEMGSIKIGAKPETATKTKAEELPIKKFAMQRIAPLVVPRLEAELAAMPGGKQKVDLANLISSLRGYTGEIDPGVLLAKSSPELQDKFNKLMDIYIKTPGLTETEFGNIVQGMIGVKGAPAAAEKPTAGKPVTEKYKPGAAAPRVSEGLSTSQIAQIEEQARKDRKPNAVYESGSWSVEVRGGKVVNMTPKKSISTVPHNFGTF